MAKNSDSVKVVFGNSWTGFDGTEYEHGKTYSVSHDLANHLLFVGKVRLAGEEQTPIGNGATGLSEPTTK